MSRVLPPNTDNIRLEELEQRVRLLETGGIGLVDLVRMLNSSAVPATETGGGVLYVESGALKYKGSSGTITTLGGA